MLTENRVIELLLYVNKWCNGLISGKCFINKKPYWLMDFTGNIEYISNIYKFLGKNDELCGPIEFDEIDISWENYYINNYNLKLIVDKIEDPLFENLVRGECISYDSLILYIFFIYNSEVKDDILFHASFKGLISILGNAVVWSGDSAVSFLWTQNYASEYIDVMSISESIKRIVIK